MKRIVIIGGGIAGLTAGIFAQKNGFKSVILEKNSNAGGECTGWDRNGYHIDGCIHWLVGTGKDTAMYKLWEKIGGLEGVEIHEPESFMAIENNGKLLHFYRDLEKMRESWKELSPEDEGAIEQFCNDIKQLQTFSMPVGKPADMMNLFDNLKYIFSIRKILPVYSKYSKITIEELADNFKSPLIRESIASMMPSGNFSAVSLIFPLSTFTSGQSSIPYGGSKKFAVRIKDKYLSLGGKIELSSEVSKVIINKNKVNGVECSNGKSYEGEYFIAACDPDVLYHKLLKNQFNDIKFENMYNDRVKYPLASNIYIGIGAEKEISGNIPRTIKIPVNTSIIKENDKPLKYLQMTHYNYEPEFAPEGCSVITIAINQFEPELCKWESLVNNKEQYLKEKKVIGDEVIRLLENHFTEMKGELKLLDIATPQTYKRYCNAYRGAFMGFWPTMKTKQMIHNGKIKGLKNLTLSGQWLQPPGGLPIAVLTGRDSIMRICRSEKIDFRE